MARFTRRSRRLAAAVLAVLALAGAGCEAEPEPEPEPERRELSERDYAVALNEAFTDTGDRIDRFNDRGEASSVSYRRALGALQAPAGLEDEQRRLVTLDKRALRATERFREVLQGLVRSQPTPEAKRFVRRDALAATQTFVRAELSGRALLVRVRREAAPRSAEREFADRARRLIDRYKGRVERVTAASRRDTRRFVDQLRDLAPPSDLREEHKRLAGSLDPLYEAVYRLAVTDATGDGEALVAIARDVVDHNEEAVEAYLDLTDELDD